MQNTNTFYMGLTQNNEAATVTLEVRDWNSPHEFTASFSTYRLVNLDKFDYVEYARGSMDGLDKSFLYDLCSDNDCTPFELPQVLADAMQEDPDSNLDLDPSLPRFDFAGDEYAWRYACGGQHDLADELSAPVDAAWCKRVIEFWKKHHLHDLNEAEMAELTAIIKDGDKYLVNCALSPGLTLVEEAGAKLAEAREYDII